VADRAGMVARNVKTIRMKQRATKIGRVWHVESHFRLVASGRKSEDPEDELPSSTQPTLSMQLQLW